MFKSLKSYVCHYLLTSNVQVCEKYEYFTSYIEHINHSEIVRMEITRYKLSSS